MEQTRDAVVLKEQKTQQPQSLLTLSFYGLTAICLLFILSLSSSLALSDVKVLAVLSCGHFPTLLVSFAYSSVWRLHELDGSLWRGALIFILSFYYAVFCQTSSCQYIVHFGYIPLQLPSFFFVLPLLFVALPHSFTFPFRSFVHTRFYGCIKTRSHK